ncbi:hypothetical protein FOA52_003976 [Chlamydomonas sp. UWO 241]|nr:hypothetical protein FOA52_003976 [Chlamydomonas sp. UWO 241]
MRGAHQSHNLASPGEVGCTPELGVMVEAAAQSSPAMSAKRTACRQRDIVITRMCPPAMAKRHTWCIDQFHLLKKIGSGYSYSVYLATCKGGLR